ncbi:hypothetical protein [Streptomyces sp. NPDC052225]|uniref:hypothetical protein n=1 Tax=Streptomyces sp. NPDC052225 TaxID=3154949 RepID=UPI0034468A72
MTGDAREDQLLMLALTGEPLPDDDPDAAAVAADIALLRDQVKGLGDALASRPAPAPAPVRAPARAPVRRRRPLRIALGALAVACAASFVGGLLWLGANAPGGGNDDAAGSAAQDKSAKGGITHFRALQLACSRWTVEGTVRSVTPRDDGDVQVVLKVKRYYRPERSAATYPTVSLTLDGAARKELKPGTLALITVPLYPEDGQDWELGRGVGDVRPELVKALPEARDLTCPGPNLGRG